MSETATALGDEKTRVTRRRILDALVEVVNEGGLPGFSVQEVADRAGVSHRTVYRHFPNRQALLAGLIALSEERMAQAGGVMVAPDADGLADVAQRNFGVFERVPDELEAAVRFSIGAKLSSERREERTEAFRRAIGEYLGDVDRDHVDAVAGVIRLLASSRSWLVLRDDLDLDGDDAGAAVAWAIRTLLEAARGGNAPLEQASTSGASR